MITTRIIVPICDAILIVLSFICLLRRIFCLNHCDQISRYLSCFYHRSKISEFRIIIVYSALNNPLRTPSYRASGSVILEGFRFHLFNLCSLIYLSITASSGDTSKSFCHCLYSFLVQLYHFLQ